ncbi:MAG TPA: transglycosylase SLT domain-containing protein [Gemmatimonadaceae bacterium]|nr:transglycosylase SLT domain-containing protein [Gemmatimonadaceae bacterium]
MDRDFRRVVSTGLYALVLASAVACQKTQPAPASAEAAVPAPPTRNAPVATNDPDVQAAQLELAAGHASAATKIVMPVLRTKERRSPAALLVAARAASEWNGWTLVRALLAFEPWIDTMYAGEARELLARSALERGEAREARQHAEASLRAESPPTARAVRYVLLARALDRLDVRDSAASYYLKAADALPAAREWLLLRAAGTTSDGKAREKFYAGVKSPAARSRIAYTEAQALERFRMDLAAANAYEKLGDMPSAYRLRLVNTADPAVRAGARAGLLGYLQREAKGDDLERGLAVLDAAFPRLDPTSELLAARRAAEGGVPSRAASGFRQVPPTMLTDADMIAWGRALIASGRPTEASTRLAKRKFSAATMPEAQYVRGLGLVRAGKRSAATSALQRVVSAYPNSKEAADALFLLGDMASDVNRDRAARDLFGRSCVHKPAGVNSDDACFRAGILSFVLGDAARAAVAFDELPKRFPSSPELSAAEYWAGRSWDKAGKRELARERWGNIVTRDPLSYYASLSSKRLQEAAWAPSAPVISQSPHFEATVARAALLRELGMEVEERYEYEGIEDEAATSPGMTLGAGLALLERGEVSRAIKLGWRAVYAARAADGDGPEDERGYRLIYPILRDSALIARSRAQRLDPAVVAAVIRRESSWNPSAVSSAGARGLMQIMPRVGQEIARSMKYPAWDPALLFDPDVSLELGTSHLRAALLAYNNLPRALAAYNAGASRVKRWSRLTGASDPEVFVERIPFVETRDYVRIVMRNAEMYRALYEFPPK